jgi:hypothetical protein
MPNQRDKNKKFVGAWLQTRLYRSVKKTAAARRVSVSEWVTEQLTHAANSTDYLAEEIVSGAADAAAATPATASVNYGAKRKTARRSKVKSAPKV